MIDTRRADLLRNAVGGNAVFSMTSGAAIVAFSAALGDHMGVARAVLVVVGTGVMIAGIAAAIALLTFGISRTLGLIALVGDVGWVAGTATILVVSPESLTTGGRWLLVLAGVMVGGFAVAEWLGLRASGWISAAGSPGRSPAPGRP
ncbi:MAG: hypothetical protein ACE5GC_11010 [Acidimicrobiia bacterium]